MKKIVGILLTAVFILAGTIIVIRVVERVEISESDKEFEVSITYSDKEGNEIIYNQYHCSDAERVKNGGVSFCADVFDPETADNVWDRAVNGESALLCEKEGRCYLIWNANENDILMLDYDPDVFSEDEILKMAESCQ